MVAVSLFWADLHGGFLDEKHGKKELKHPDNLLRRSSYLGRQKVPDHRSKEHRSRRDSTLAIASGAAARTIVPAELAKIAQTFPHIWGKNDPWPVRRWWKDYPRR